MIVGGVASVAGKGRRRMRYSIFLAVAFFWGITAEARGTDAPTTQPSGLSVPSGAFPAQFRLLLTRNIFARNGRPAEAAKPTSEPTTPQTSFALRGVLLDNGVYTAIIEDTTSHKIQHVFEGSTLSGGKVMRITLRGFQFEAAGTTTTVALGQDLNGVAAAVIPPSAAPTTAPNPGAPTKGKHPTIAEGATPVPDVAPLPEAAAVAMPVAPATEGDGSRLRPAND